MRKHTAEALSAVLKADGTITPSERRDIMAAATHHGRTPDQPKAEHAEPRVLRRREVAERLGRSLRFVDSLASRGILQKVKLPGRHRAIGFSSLQVEKLCGGAE